jgi:cupin superfamily acireductone dioxygenase involved in methionine salvage
MADQEPTREDWEGSILEVPQGLADMRCVYAGQPATTEAKRVWRQMFEQKPGQFVSEYMKAENAYRVGLKALKREPEQKGEAVDEVVVDEGSERSEEMVRRLIKEATHDDH